MASDISKVVRALEEQGFHLEKRESGRLFVRDQRNEQVVATISVTSTNPRSLSNSIAQLRRAGFLWQGR